jgi:hypothetical protein
VLFDIRDEWCLADCAVILERWRHHIRKSALGDERQRRWMVRRRPELRGVLDAVELGYEELLWPWPAV